MKKKVSKNLKSSAARSSQTNDKSLREHLLYLLRDGGAHAGFDAAVGDWPIQLAGVKVANFPHTAWMLLEHLRLAQFDILEFSRNPKHVSPPWPEGYWPASEAPASEKSWKESVETFKKDLKAIEELVAEKRIDLFAKIPWGDGQTILREALLVADHNAYHIGQLVDVRRLLGAWPEE